MVHLRLASALDVSAVINYQEILLFYVLFLSVTVSRQGGPANAFDASLACDCCFNPFVLWGWPAVAFVASPLRSVAPSDI